MGILSTEDLEGGEGGGANGGDEVLAELERCQAELKVKDNKNRPKIVRILKIHIDISL